MTKIAIIGGGFAGSTAAAELSRCPGLKVELFDMGARGVGGRSSHRRVRRSDSKVIPDDGDPLGAQLVRLIRCASLASRFFSSSRIIIMAFHVFLVPGF